MNEARSLTETRQMILACAGTAVLNRAHQRTFSFNVFHMNAVELIEATHRVKDPNQGIALMAFRNRDASTQAHRELNRHIHNFVASAQTLVEHTRAHMRKHYEDMPLWETYTTQVANTFARSPVAQFVQGLRNFMVHRGLPASQMFMSFTASPGATDGSGTTETGVRISTASLLEWDKWKSEARTYLATAGTHLDVQQFAQEYLTLASRFQGWLEDTITNYHRPELEELADLQSRLDAAELAQVPTDAPPGAPTAAAADDAEAVDGQVDALDAVALEIFATIRPLEFETPATGFPSERQALKLTADDLAAAPVMWGQTQEGIDAVAFIRHGAEYYGLAEEDYASLEALRSRVRTSPWALDRVSDEFTDEVFIDWARARFEGAAPEAFSAALARRAGEKVRPAEVWTPIAHMEVEEGFAFGPVRIEPMSAALIDRIARMLPGEESAHRSQANQLVEDLTARFQGSAAVRIELVAEARMAQARALRLAQDAIGLLRFFSAPAMQPHLFSPVSLSGAESVPMARVLVLQAPDLMYSETVLPAGVRPWRLSKRELARLRADSLDLVGSLVSADGLTDFALAVRASLLVYSRSTTVVDPMDRLRMCMSAVEGVFLRHELEPHAHSLAERITPLLEGEGVTESVGRTVRLAYWLQEQPGSHRVHRWQQEAIFAFIRVAHQVLRVAVANVDRFASKAEFLDAINRRRVEQADGDH